MGNPNSHFHSISHHPPSPIAAPYTQEDSGKLKTIVQFDCRGLEPVAFSPRTGWIVKCAEGGPSFADVDLSEDDWVEYDTKNDVPVEISEFKSSFVKMKK